jgi:tellurite resistance protein
MVSKTKSKTRKKGKQTRGTRKSKPLKKRGAKKTNTRVARPKKVSTRAQQAGSRRSRVADSSGQENELLAQENASSISSVDENVTNDEQQGELQFTRPDATLKEATTDESLDIEQNIEDQNSGASEIV